MRTKRVILLAILPLLTGSLYASIRFFRSTDTVILERNQIDRIFITDLLGRGENNRKGNEGITIKKSEIREEFLSLFDSFTYRRARGSTNFYKDAKWVRIIVIYSNNKFHYGNYVIDLNDKGDLFVNEKKYVLVAEQEEKSRLFARIEKFIRDQPK